VLGVYVLYLNTCLFWIVYILWVGASITGVLFFWCLDTVGYGMVGYGVASRLTFHHFFSIGLPFTSDSVSCGAWCWGRIVAFAQAIPQKVAPTSDVNARAYRLHHHCVSRAGRLPREPQIAASPASPNLISSSTKLPLLSFLYPLHLHPLCLQSSRDGDVHSTCVSARCATGEVSHLERQRQVRMRRLLFTHLLAARRAQAADCCS
jgi:hypothetical protein